MAVDLVVKNSRVVLPGAIINGGVAISNGKIATIASDGALPKGDVEYDGGGNYLLPGAIDVHVHFREPGYEYKEDFSTGSAAAAAGGVTTVFDMPSGIPSVDSSENLRKKLETIAGRSFVDYGQYGMITDQNFEDLPRMVEDGAIGFKLYMSTTAVKVSVPNDYSILRAFRRLAELGLPVAVHAENHSIVMSTMEEKKSEGKSDILSYALSRPIVSEREAVQRAALFAQEAGTSIHIVHVSSGEGVRDIAWWKGQRVKVTAETCPHYLFLGPAELERLGKVCKINPPIRGGDNRQDLWDGIRNGSLDVIASDHSPHKPEEKENGDIWSNAAGFTGVQTSLPLMLTAADQGRLSFQDCARLMAENPARIFGLYPRKGAIAIGSDADLVLVEVGREWKVSAEKLKSKTKVTPFEGWTVSARPIATILRGQVAMEDGEIAGKPVGQMVRQSRQYQAVP